MPKLFKRIAYSIPLIALALVVFFGGVVNKILVLAHVVSPGAADRLNDFAGVRSALADVSGPSPASPDPDGGPCPDPGPAPDPGCGED